VPSAAATQIAPPRTGTSASQHSSISCRYSTLSALLYQVDYCTETNTGFDFAYTPVYLDRNSTQHPMSPF
jgi:hypothetical protein